jgi:hypothetical protein
MAKDFIPIGDTHHNPESRLDDTGYLKSDPFAYGRKKSLEKRGMDEYAERVRKMRLEPQEDMSVIVEHPTNISAYEQVRETVRIQLASQKPQPLRHKRSNRFKPKKIKNSNRSVNPNGVYSVSPKPFKLFTEGGFKRRKGRNNNASKDVPPDR